MTDGIPDIDFARIRPYGQPATRSNAFEELTSLLLQQGAVDWPEGARFHRFGNPDGGREGKGVLPNGDVWAWQAKYLFEFDSSAAKQVTGSIRRALDLETNLKRYFVALPIDLPAGDTKQSVSAQTRWNEKVAEWEALARGKGLEVEFIFIGAHQLLTELTEPRHAGRARYWFGQEALGEEWQTRRLEEAIAKAGRRYTPKLHVELETVQAFDAIGRTATYVQRWQRALAELREARQWGWRAPADAVEVLKEATDRASAALDDADGALELMIAAARTTDALPQIDSGIDGAFQAVLDVDHLLHEHCLTNDRYFVGEAASLYSKVRKALGALRRADSLTSAVTTDAASEKLLLLTGRAGVGKTHLFCDVAARRIAAGRPTILLLGQDFDSRSPLHQVGELAQLHGNLDEVLGLLNAAGEAAGVIGLLMIDALNESERPERWRDDTRALVTTAAHYSHVAVVLSCRSELIEPVIDADQIPTFEHVGFAEATDIAVRRFTHEFGLEPPTFPVLNPEFSNPLFLKLTCESLKTLGAQRFPLGSAGLTTICSAFLEAVNRRLSEPGRCDYDERDEPVPRAVGELARLGAGPFERTAVQRIATDILPDRPWSRSLLRGLLHEGVLIELGDGRITFGYQRLGDVMRATAVAGRSEEDVRAWLYDLGDEVWREAGVLGALAVLVPEKYGVELVDLAGDDEGAVSYEVIDSFLESLVLRSPRSVSPRTIELVERLIDHEYRVDEIWDRLVRIACVPGHPLNAEWLHSYLTPIELAERDGSWSAWLVGAIDPEEETAVGRLLEWAWPSDRGNRTAVSDEVVVLATQLFGWLLTTTDRRVRDRATKALVSVGERDPVAFAEALARFRGNNDPYVVERLTAAACGVVLRSQDPNAAQVIAAGVSELIADGWPLHLITRDFVRRIYGAAREGGWEGPDGLPPYGAQWPIPTRSVADIEALAGPPDYLYGSIWNSVTGWGDFGRYVLRSALTDVASKDPKALQQNAEQAVFDRVLALGWSPERFQEIDTRRSGLHDGPVERVGKKYQWIAFYEILGRIADNHAIKASWGEDEPQSYAFAEQLVWRDIDPTILVRKPASRRAQEPPWFSPVSAHFSASIADDYPSDMKGVPDPLTLIAVTDPGGRDWLTLVTNPVWEQPLAPEVKALRPPQVTAWMQVHCYLVRTKESAALCEWAKGKDWFGRWMPETAEAHNVLLSAHPLDPRWSAADGEVEWWDAGAGRTQPADLWNSAAWYAGTGTSRDASADEQTCGYVPTRPLLDLLGSPIGQDFTWMDTSGVALWDPSVVVGGPSSLVMRRDLSEYIQDSGMTFFWTVLVGKERLGRDRPIPGDEYRWVNASASYLLHDGRVEQVGATANRCRPGPEVERELEWVTKSTER